MLLLIKEHTDTLIEQTKTKAQEAFKFLMNKQMETFSLSSPINLGEASKWLLAVTFFEATNSIYNITDEDISFATIIECHWFSKGGVETFTKLQTLLQLRSKNENKLHIEEVRKKGNHLKIGQSEYKISDLDTRKEEMIEQLKNVEYNDFEAMVFRMELTYHEAAELLYAKYIDAKSLDTLFHQAFMKFLILIQC